MKNNFFQNGKQYISCNLCPHFLNKKILDSNLEIFTYDLKYYFIEVIRIHSGTKSLIFRGHSYGVYDPMGWEGLSKSTKAYLTRGMAKEKSMYGFLRVNGSLIQH